MDLHYVDAKLAELSPDLLPSPIKGALPLANAGASASAPSTVVSSAGAPDFKGLQLGEQMWPHNLF